MPDIDISKIEVGDRITLGGEFVVIEVDPHTPEQSVAIEFGGRSRWVPTTVITAHHPKPKPLAVGDEVRDVEGIWTDTATIRGVHGNLAWLGGDLVVNLGRLERVS